MAAKRKSPTRARKQKPKLAAGSEADRGLSLEELGQALADRLAHGDDPYAEPTDEFADNGLAVPGAPNGEQRDPVDRFELTPRGILEALLFVGGPASEPLSSRRISSLMRGVRAAEIDALIRELNEDYRRRNCPYTIADEGAGYRLKLRDQFARLRDRFYGKARLAKLSQAAIEVLAAVAYRAPLTLEEISRLRGKPSGPLVTQLVRRQLLRLERAPDKPRRARYYTTDRFLQLFGLENLDELPRGHDASEP
jgi:segregation and condensation protein B